MKPFAIVIALFALVACGGAQDDYVDRMASEHAEDAPDANPMSVAVPEAKVVTTEVVYGQIDGRDLVGTMAVPEGSQEPLSGIIVIHEWWGLNDNIRAMAERLANQGYRALAVDLYGGQTADAPEQARALMMEAMGAAESQVQNLTQAHAFLKIANQAPSIGVVGWCFGGTWTLRSALALGDSLDGAVMYYGQPVTDKLALASLKAPLLGLFGEDDGGIPVADVRTFEAELEDMGADAEIVIYPGAGHAFANPSGHNYQAEAAEDSWRRTVEFFARNLQK